MNSLLFDEKVSVADILQTVALCVTIATFIFQSWRESLRRAAADADAQEARRVQIYQTLEIESNGVFRFEAEHKYVLPLYKSHLAPANPDAIELPDNDGTVVTIEERHLAGRKYYELTCNLFEVSARLRRKDIVDHTVFGSWVAWFFDVLTEWGFRAAWDDLRDNYTPDLRMVFDAFVARLVNEWDLPHAQGRLSLPHDGLTVGDAPLEKLREDFYRHVGEKFECSEILEWLAVAERDRPPAHPLAFR